MMLNNIKKYKSVILYLFTTLLLCGLILYAMKSGGIEIGFKELWNGLFVEYDARVDVIFEMRFPRIIVAILAGALMSMSGVLLQAVMRNPLADPGIMGINAGSAFVTVIVLALFPTLAGFTPIVAFVGGMIAFGIVYFLAYDKGISPMKLVLVGVGVEAIFSALYKGIDAFTRGGYSNVANLIDANISLKDWNDVTVLCIYALIVILLVILIAPRCDYLLLSDATTRSLGIDIHKMRMIVSIIAVLMASVFTAIVGTVSFLGLVVPHLARILVGSQHKRLLPYSALLGATIFLFADTVGRMIAYPYEISSSIIMGLIGAPLFLYLLKRKSDIYES